MGFNESMQEDIRTVLFDLEELASVHDIDGREVRVVIADESFEDASGNSHFMHGSASGMLAGKKETAINDGTVRFYVMEQDVDRKLTVNAMLRFDGESMFIQSVQRLGGMYCIGIGRFAV